MVSPALPVLRTDREKSPMDHEPEKDQEAAPSVINQLPEAGIAPKANVLKFPHQAHMRWGEHDRRDAVTFQTDALAPPAPA